MDLDDGPRLVRPPGSAGGLRRGLLIAALACLVGAAVALLAATRTWEVEVIRRPLPQPPAHTPLTGTTLAPWLLPLALVGLAGAGALLATRGRGRSLVGFVLTLAGLGILAGGVYGLVAVSGVRPAWPALCLPCGVLIAAGGVRAVTRGRSWATMDSRYELPTPTVDTPIEPGGPSRREIAMWDALDRGEDPTCPER